MSYGYHNGKKYDARHGGPFDRGSADAYYGRPEDPHYYVGGTSKSKRVDYFDMTDEDIEAYNAGYESTPFGQKDYG